MNEVIEPLTYNEPIREVPMAQHAPARTFDPRQASARGPWSSSLSESDLHCLLQLIEAELIPHLISGYSPARCSPQELSP